MSLRRGGTADSDAVLGLFDEAVEWLCERGSPDQWGTRPWSERPEAVQRVRSMLSEDGTFIAEHDGEPVGVTVVAEHPTSYVPTTEEDHLYIHLLLVSRRYKGHRIGSQLLGWARAEALRRGLSLLRVDCFAGAEGKLIRYYESQGFTKVTTFDVNGWPGQLLEQRLS